MYLFNEKYGSEIPDEVLDDEVLANFGYWQLQELLISLGLPEEIHYIDGICNAFSYHYFEKGTRISPVDSSQDYFIFLIDGCVFQQNNDGSLNGLFAQGHIVFNYPSLKMQLDFNNVVKAYTNCHTLIADIEKLEFLIGRGLMTTIMGQIVLRLSNYYKSLFEIGKLPAKNQIDGLMKKFPILFEQFKHKDIAKLTGIAAETFSRKLPRKLSKKT